MPIYESNGKKYNIPDDRVNDFIKSRSDAKLIDNTPYHLSRATSTPRQSNIQNQTDTQVEETPVQQPNNGIAGGFTTFKDGTSGFIPAMKMPDIKIEQPKIDISSAGTGKDTGLLQPFGKSKPLTESIGDAMKNMPIRPEAQFDMAQSTYKQNQDWIKEVQNDPSISPEVKKALLDDYNKNIRISDNTIEDKDLPLYAKKWLEENKVSVPTTVYVQGSPMFGGGQYVESTKQGNTPEQIAFIKDFIANTPQGQDLVNRQKAYVKYLENSISDVETRVPELKKKYWQEQYDLSRSHPYPMGKTKGKAETDAARKDYLEKYGALKKRMSALNLAEKNAEEQKKLLAAVRDGDLNVLSQFGKQIGRDFWEMAGDIGTLGIRPMMQSLYESSDVKGLQKRMESGEPLSEEDRLAMSALANNQAYQELMGDRRTIAQEVASGITQSAPFMVNFATTGGIGKAVTGGAKELLKQGIKRNAVNALRSGVNANTVKIGSRLAGFGLNVADATGRASVMAAISPHTYRDMFDNMTGQVTYGYDEEGKPYYLGNIEQMDLANALLNAWGSNTIENVSEFSGFGMEKGQATLSRLLKQRVPEVAKALSFGSTRNQFFQGVNKAMKTAGFNGTVNEFLEEQVATVLHSFFEDGQAQWSDLVDPRQQFITFLTVASIGSGSAIMNTGGNQLMKYGARKAYDNAFQDFGTEFYNSQNNDIAGQFADAVRNGTIEEKQNSLADIVNSDLFNDKQKLAALNLYRAGLTYESYEGTKEAQVEEATQEIPAIIEENVNPEMGAVVSATIAGMDMPVQITGGNIVQNEDGTINREQSDREIYYTDADGKRQVTSINYVENITENVPAQDAIAQVTEQVAAPIIAQQQNEEVRPYQAGETVRFSPDGNTSLIGQIEGQDQATGNYILSVETPNGIQQMQVQPRQIINEDNLEGVENGSPVIYTNQNGEQVQDVVATTPDLYAQGLIGFENGDVVKIENVVGLAQNPDTVIPVSEQNQTVTDGELPPPPADMMIGENGAVPYNPNNTATNKPRVFEIEEGLSAVENADGTYALDKQFAKSELKKADSLVKRLNEDYSDNGLVFETVQLPRKDASNPFEKPLWGVVARMQPETVSNPQPIVTDNAPVQPLERKQEKSVKKDTRPKKPTTFQRRLQAVEPNVSTVRDRILYGIASGTYKFRWKDQGVSMGLARELGLTGSETERRSRISLLSNNGYTPSTLAHRIWEETGMQLNDNDIRSEVIEVLSSISSPKQALETLESSLSMNEDTYYQEQQDAAEFEQEQIRQAQDFQLEISEQLAAMDIDNLLTLAKELGLSPEEIDNIHTAYELAEQIEQLEQIQNEETELQSGRDRTNEETDSVASRSGSSSETTERTVGERNRSSEETGDRTSDRDSQNDYSDLTAEERRIVDETNALIDAEVNDVSTQLQQKKSELNAAKKRIGNAYAEDNQTNLFGQEQTSDTLFDVPRDFSQSNVANIIEPIQQEVNALTDKLNDLNNSRNERINEALENFRSQGTIDFETEQSNVAIPEYNGNIVEYIKAVGKNVEVSKAESTTNTNPTDAQKEAGNYKKGKVTIQGLDISIEQPRGSERTGTNESGKQWSVTMNNAYGYIRKTKGKDGDHIDVFLGANPESKTVFVVDQMNQDGSFDEHKVMLGFDSIEQAREAYLSNYEEGWQGLGNITQTDIDTFKKWAKSDTRKIKPFAEYKEIQENPYAASNQDYVEFTTKPPMNDIEVRNEYLRADLEHELSSTNVPLVAMNELRSRFGLEQNNGTQLTPNQKELVDNAEKSIRKKLGRKYPELKASQPKEMLSEVKKRKKDGKYIVKLDRRMSKTPLVLMARRALQYNGKWEKASNSVVFDNEADAKAFRENERSLGEGTHFQFSTNIFKPVNEQTFNSLVDRLRETGLARDVITDKAAFDAKLDEVVNDNATAKQTLSEMDTIKQEAIANSTFMLAPNGKPTKLNENQWLQVRTKPFLDWFGDWINNPESASKVVDENGEPMVVYHGTGTTITSFDNKKATDKEGREWGVGTGKGVFSFTDDYQTAQSWANRSSDRGKWGVPSDNPNIISAFLNFRHPITRDEFRDMVDKKLEGYSFIPQKERDKAIASVYRELRKNKVDGLIASFGEYTAFTPTQIKSAISNTGEFDRRNPDIRMQVLEDSSNNLIVLHNLTEEKLESAMRIGGLPMPSIAITSPKSGFTQYGEISLIGSKDVIDPANRKNKVFGADAYSPRYPNIVFVLKDSDQLDSIIDLLPKEMQSNAHYRLVDKIQDEGSRYLWESGELKTAFAMKKGADIVSHLQSKYSNEILNYVDSVKGYDFFDVKDNEDVKRKLTELWAKDNEVLLNAPNMNLIDENGILKETMLKSIFNEAKQDLRNKGKVDEWKTKNNANDYINKNNLLTEYKQFVSDFYDNLDVEEKIYKGYTPSGKRKYVPHTLDNVMKEMKAKGIRGSEGWFYGAGSARSKVAPQFKSIKDIQKSRDKIVSAEEFKAVKDEMADEFTHVTKTLEPFYKYESNIAEYMVDEMARLVSRGESESFNSLSDEARKTLSDFIEKIKSVPTQYFEAKPQRAVEFDEFTGAVVPKEASDKIKQLLRDNGLEVIEYSSSEERASKIDEFTRDRGIQFMRTNVGDVYGFVTPDGTVYLDSTRMNANTPIHEFGHLWNSFTKENNAELYNRGAELVKESEYWQRVNDNPSYRDLSDEAKVDEALAMAIGDKGEAIVNRNLKQRFVDWVKDVWNSIREAFGFKTDIAVEDMTLSDFTRRAVRNLLEGKRLVDVMQPTVFSAQDISEMEQIKQSSIDDGSFMKAPNGEPTNLTERQWLQVRTSNFKNWFGDWQNDTENSSKIVDENGEPKVVFHGTTHQFYEFTQDRGNVENHFGIGYYFSDSLTDIENNYLATGADLTNRIDRLAEQLEDNEDLSPEEARERAEEELKGSDEIILDVYLNMRYPMDVRPDAMYYDALEVYDEENDEYTENEDSMPMELYNALNNIQYNFSEADAQSIWNDVSDAIGQMWEGTSAYDVDKALRSSESLMYITDDEGNLASHEFIRSLYEEMGYDGIIMDADLEFGNRRESGKSMDMDSDTSHYIMFDPSKIKSATENKGDFNRDMNDIRFQSVNDVADAADSTMTEDMRNELDKRIKTLWFRIREAYEDRHLAVQKFLDVLRENGTEVAEHNDFYKKATHINGAIDAQLEQYNNKYQKPLNKAISELEKAGFDYRDIENYAILKHGLERNAWMKQDAINQYMANNPEATPEQIARFEQKLPDDFSGITAVEKEVGKHAEWFINDFEEKAGKDLIDNLWKRVKDATSYSLNKQLEGQLIDKKTIEDLISRYDYYVPLRGHDAEVAEDRWDYSPDMGTYFVAPLLKAKGRKTRSESPFAYIASMAQSAINSANRNILNQTILRLALKDKTNLLNVNKAWYEKTGERDGKPVYEVRSPEYNEDPETYRKNIEEFEERMAKLAEAGLAVQSGKKLDIGGLFIKRKQADQHEVHVFQNGTEHVVYINANPAVARAINGSNAKDLHKDLRFFARVSRQMAANFTTRNPIFVLSNFSRDYIFSSSILPVKEDAKYFVQFQRNMIPSADALQRYVRGKADLSKQQDRYLNEYILNGAKTGFSHILELQKVQKQIERDIKKGEGRNVFRYLLDGLEGMNEFAENLSRLSVYITSREQGRSITQSVSDAKEVTVNFNRSGAGGLGAAWFRSLYLFVNAGIQALSNFAKVAQKNKAKTAMLISSYAMSGFLMPMLTALIGGDDGLDDYLKLSDWERQNNLCIYTGNGFIKIPLPHELRVFHKMGDEIYQSMFGKKDVTQSLLDTALGFSDLIPANPMGAVDGSWADIMPDATKPFFQLAANRNFTGSRITNEWADPNKPGYLRVRTNKKGEPFAPAFLVKLAETLDNTTGGDGVEKGLISFNPDVVNHLMRGYFGGLYNMGMQGLDITSKTYDLTKTGEFKLKVRETPLKTFYTSESDLQTSSSGLNTKYFKVVDDTQEAMRKVKGYKEQVGEGKLSIDDFYKKIENLNVPKADELYGRIKQIKKYESALKELDGQDQKDLEKIISDLKKEVIEVNNKLSE